MVPKNFIKNLAVDYISCVSERPTKICDQLHGPLMDWRAERGPEASPAQFPHILALQSSPKYTVTQLAVHDYTVSQKKHVTTFFAITGTMNVRL